MEREKRKRTSPEESGGVVGETKRKKKKTRKEERETAPAEVEEPTMEEVEEFYAILRRMDVALRYLKGVQKRPRAAETSAVVGIREVEEHKELNLNEVPADSSD